MDLTELRRIAPPFLLSPRRRMGSESMPAQPFGSLPDDRWTALAIAELLDAHTPVRMPMWRWWVSALDWDDEPAIFTMTHVATEAGVQPSRLVQSRLSADECERIAAVVTPQRDRLFGPMLAWLVTDTAETLTMMDSFPDDFGPRIRARRDHELVMRCLEPLTPAPEPESRRALTNSPVAPILVSAGDELVTPLECSACHNVWTPRVPYPKKCPRCQRYIAWDAQRPSASSAV